MKAEETTGGDSEDAITKEREEVSRAMQGDGMNWRFWVGGRQGWGRDRL